MIRSLLIIDDDSGIRASLARALRSVADPIVVASSGEEALTRLGEARFAIVPQRRRDSTLHAFLRALGRG